MFIKVKTPSRIHITLIDLNGSIGRVDGGVGFALNQPSIVVELRKGKNKCISKNTELKKKAENTLNKLKSVFGFEAEVSILEEYKPHCGLGSGTQLSLAIAKAYSELFGIKLSVRELAKIVGRGGTSGIGVAVFEKGGFIVDGGHSLTVKKGFSPSSLSKAPPPPVIFRYDFPWKVAIVIPEVLGFAGRREVNLFEKNCPIPIEEVRELSHIILMKLLPSVVEEDIDSFRKTISKIQKIGFKKIEVNMHSDIGIPELLEQFEGAGMSSTGTAIYIVVESEKEGKILLKDMKKFFEEKGIECETLIATPNNTGARVELNEV